MNNELLTLDMMMSSEYVCYENIDTLISMNEKEQLYKYSQSKESQKNTFSSNSQDSVSTAIGPKRAYPSYTGR